MVVYSRFVIHREAVEQVEEIEVAGYDNRSVFVSYCEDKLLFIWGYNARAHGGGSFVTY